MSGARGARIASTGGWLPGEPITNERIEELVGPLPDGLLEGMHMERRHWIADPETGEHSDSTSGMAAKAARQALGRAGIEPADLELLMVATGTPDYVLPPAVALVQDELGIERCAIFELRSGGAGVVQALDLARTYIEAGRYRNACVIGCDSISPLQAELLLGERRLKVRDRLLTYMFGDGAGAVVLEACEEPTVVGAAVGCIGTGRSPGMEVRGGGGTYAPFHRQELRNRTVELHIDIEQASSFTATLTTEAVAHVLRDSGVDVESIDVCVTPEADTEWMSEAVAQGVPAAEEWASLEPKVFNALPSVGAPGCAALPLGLDRAWTSGRLRAGERALILGMETTKWIYAAMIVDWAVDPPGGGGA